MTLKLILGKLIYPTMRSKIFIAAIILIVTQIACRSEKAKAIKYHDDVILNIHNVYNSITATEEVFEQTDTLKVEKQLLNLELVLNKAIDNIKKIPPYKNDTTLKLAAMNLLFFYQKTVIEQYQSALVRMKETQSTSKKDIILGLAIFSTYNTEDSLNAVFENEIVLFEKKYMKE